MILKLNVFNEKYTFFFISHCDKVFSFLVPELWEISNASCVPLKLRQLEIWWCIWIQTNIWPKSKSFDKVWTIKCHQRHYTKQLICNYHYNINFKLCISFVELVFTTKSPGVCINASLLNQSFSFNQYLSYSIFWNISFLWAHSILQIMSKRWLIWRMDYL